IGYHGGAGGASSGGSAGAADGGLPEPCFPIPQPVVTVGQTGGAGAQGTGGQGGNSLAVGSSYGSESGAGGGGGGGWYGGGGGGSGSYYTSIAGQVYGAAGGGGAGSSYFESGATATGAGTATNGTAEVTITPVSAPGAPTGASATSSAPASATVSFTPPSDDGGTPITGYTVTSTDLTDQAAQSVTATGSGSPITVGGLTNGDSYTFTIAATNAAGAGPSSAPSNPTTLKSTSTSLTASPSPGVVGQAVTYTATVTPRPDGGTVSFSDAGGTISGCGAQSVSTSDGTATCVTSYSKTGTEQVTATYAGDNTFPSSTSHAVEEMIDQAATSTVVRGAPDPAEAGWLVTYTATVSPSPDGGSVTFSDGQGTLCGSVPVSGGTASCSLYAWTAGSDQVSAVYSGDSNYQGSTGSVTEQIHAQLTTTVLSAYPSSVTVGQQLTFMAVVSPKPDRGTVSFSDAGGTIKGCDAVTVSDGTAECETSYATAGSEDVTAAYSGDAGFEPSASVSAVTVDKGSSSTSVKASPSPAQAGRAVTYTATVSPSAAGGSVSFLEGQSTLSDCGSVAVSGGTASCSTSYPASGSHEISAIYGGDANYTGSSGDVTEQIDKLSTATSLTVAPSPGAVNQAVTLTATVSPVPDGGTVSFASGATTISACSSQTIDVNGKATCTIDWTAGTYAFTASYGGDGAYAGSTSSPVGETIDRASTSTGLTSSANPASVGDKVTYTATVSPVPDGGTVSFSDASSGISGCGSQPVSGSDGTATCVTTYSSVGTDQVTAAYAGNGDYDQSSSGPITETVVATATSTALKASPSSAGVGDPVTYTATVSPVPDGGIVAFGDGGATISGCASQAVSAADGTATCVVTYPTSGKRSVTAAYGGHGNYASSTSDPVDETVHAAPTQTVLSASPASAVTGQEVTYIAKVSPAPDGGTVAFADGGQPVTGCGSEPVGADGSASCKVSYASAGSHSLTAAYGGNADFAGSVSSAVSETLSAPVASPPTGTGGSPGGGTPSGGSPGGGSPGGSSPGGGSPTGGVPHPRSSIVKLSGAVLSRGGVVVDRISCSGSSACRVTETLTTVVLTRGGRLLGAVAAGVRTTRVPLLVGSRMLTVPAGKTESVSIALRPAARRLLARLGRLPVLLTVSEIRGGKRVTLARRRLVIVATRAKHHHKKHN
ncbi:MAG: Ig-like domain repeat protein, partial [Solirubrobacteraceae bacterium]